MTFPTDEEDAAMKGSLHESAKEALSDEAAEWFVRLRDDRSSMRHRERNVRWLKQSPAHIAELLRIQQVYKVCVPPSWKTVRRGRRGRRSRMSSN